MGFYTTPAFLALWNTNDSNQHRVTANQTLLAALGQSFTERFAIVPLSQDGLDCHARRRRHGVRRLPQEPGSDAPVLGATSSTSTTATTSRRATGSRARRPTRGPRRSGGGFAFGDVNETGPDIAAWGRCSRRSRTAAGCHRFSIAIAQDLCFWANSAPCSETDAEFRRVVGAFQNSTPFAYNFAVLIKEFFASPLVTGAVATGTYPSATSVPVSISRRDHLCAALSNRLGKPDLCAQAVPVPQLGADRDRDDRAERGRRCVQPRLADPGHAVRSDAVLPFGQRAPVLEHRRAGRRPDLRAAASTP